MLQQFIYRSRFHCQSPLQAGGIHTTLVRFITRRRSPSKLLALVAATLILNSLVSSANAYSTKAKAKGSTLYAVSSSSPSGSGTGKFHLGNNKAKITGHGTDTTGRGYGYYEDFAGASGRARAHNASRGTEVTATSTISVGYEDRGWYDWNLELFAEVERDNSYDPKGKAKAKGDDPQYFDPASLLQNPMFSQDISLLPGTTVYTFDSTQEFAWLSLDGMTSLLAQPVFTIDIKSLGQGAVDATVTFNKNPHLSFSTKPAVLEAMIENPQYGLGTDEGLTQALSFSWALDTSAFKVTGEDWVGGGMEAHAIVPEAGDFNLDGEVDGRDFLAWQGGGSPDPFSSTDLGLWHGQYGVDPSGISESFALASAASAVPEPGTIVLGLLSLSLVICRRSRQISA